MEKILKEIQFSPFSYWNFAQNGLWEEAVQFRIGDDLGALRAWVENASQDVAFEAFFETGSAPALFFLGGRLSQFDKLEQIFFIENLMTRVEPGSDFSTVVGVLADILKKPDIFRNLPDFMELGIVNQWKSVGGFKVWTRGAEGFLEGQEEIREKAPQLLAVYKNPATLEMAWNAPIPHWLGLPVAWRQGEGYCLDFPEYERLVRGVLED